MYKLFSYVFVLVAIGILSLFLNDAAVIAEIKNSVAVPAVKPLPVNTIPIQKQTGKVVPDTKIPAAVKSSPLKKSPLQKAQPKQYSYTATLKGTSKQKGSIDFKGIKWSCQGMRCTTRGPWSKPGVKSCNQLARKVGQVTAYGHPGKKLSKGEIAQCNQGVIKADVKAAGKSAKLPGSFKQQKPSLAKSSSLGLISAGKNQNKLKPSLAKPSLSPKMLPKNTLPKNTLPKNALSKKSLPGTALGGGMNTKSKNSKGLSAFGSSTSTQKKSSESKMGSTAFGSAAKNQKMINIPVTNTPTVRLDPAVLAKINTRRQLFNIFEKSYTRKIVDALARSEEIRRTSGGSYGGVNNGGDCNDHRADVHPGLVEVCDGVDNNCNGDIDEGVKVLIYVDADGDLHGDPKRGLLGCLEMLRGPGAEPGEWWSLTGNDCDDTDPDVWHGC